MPSPAPATHSDTFQQPYRGARVAAAIAVAVLVLVPSSYSFHLVSFSHAKLTALAAGAALLAWFVPPEQVWNTGRVRLFLPLFMLVLWAGGGAAFQVDDFLQSTGMLAGASYLVLMLAALLVLAAAPGLAIQRALVFSCVPVAVLALGQFAGLLSRMFPVFPEYNQRMYSVFGNQDLLGGYLAIGLALGLALWLSGALRGWVAALVFVSAFPALLLSGSRSAWLAALAGSALAVWAARGATRKFMGAGVAIMAMAIVVVLLVPGATWQRIAGTFAVGDVGYRIRRWIWDGTVHLIGQHPIAGVGLGNYGYRSPLALGEVLHARGPGVHMFNHIQTTHAHSDVLEIAAEAGVVGVLLLGAFLIQIPRRRATAWAGLAAAFVFSLINTTLHSPPHVLAVLLLASALLEPSPASRSEAASALERRVHGAVLAVALIALAFVVVEPSWKHARAQALYDAGDFESAERAYRDAAYMPGNHAAAYEYAVLLANARRDNEAMETAAYAARGVDTGDVNYLRAYLAERNLPMRAAADHFRACLERWPDHRLAYEGLVRNSGPSERAAILAEAEQWLPPEDYTAVMAQPSAPR